MGVKIYVAGGWVEQHQRARPMIAKLRAAGVEITCDWTQAEGDVCECGHHRQEHQPFKQSSNALANRWPTACAVMLSMGPVGDVEECRCTTFNGIGSGGDSKLTAENRRKFARADLDGVLAADVVWLLAANDKGAAGSWVELGAALAAVELRPHPAKPVVVVSGPKWNRTIFTELADSMWEDDEDALKLVLKMAAERSGTRAKLSTGA
jgi:hypothetical protein